MKTCSRLLITKRRWNTDRGSPKPPKNPNAMDESLTITTPMSSFATHRTTRNAKPGAWIFIQPTITNGFSLSKEEWRYAMRRRYGLELLDLPKCCNGSGANFTIEHAVVCQKGGLGLGWHNKVKADTGGISIQALGSNRVRYKSKIIICHDTPDTNMLRSTPTHPPSRSGLDPPPLHTILHITTFQPQPHAIIWLQSSPYCRTLGEANGLRYWHESDQLGSSIVLKLDPGAGACFSRKSKKEEV